MNKPDERVFTPEYPELGTGPVPTEPNISPAYFEREREQVFKKSWLNVGFELDIPNNGDYFVKDIEVLNSSLIIVRGQDGVVRAFHNACTHRGNKVAEECGHTKGFACGFHGWTFNTEGDLAFVPDESQFFDLDKPKLGLKPVPCETWKGFIFIHPEEKPPQSLPNWLDGMGRQIEEWPFDKMVRIGKWRAEVNCNWKVIIDAFQESYHASFVHSLTAGDAMVAEDNPYIRCKSFRLYNNGHRSGSCPLNPDHTPTPAEALAGRLTTTMWLHGDEQFKGVNPEGHDAFMFDINVLFPNFFVDLTYVWMLTYNFWPVSVDKTIYEINYFMQKPENPGELISQECSRVAIRDLLREDLSTVETTQQALMSGAIDTIQLSDQELLVRHQYKVVDDLINNK